MQRAGRSINIRSQIQDEKGGAHVQDGESHGVR